MTEIDRDRVCVLIPALNEKNTIGSVISGIKEKGYTHILIVDGHSTDGTVEIAQELGATVYLQKGKGKGIALVEAFKQISEPYILMLDADGTNPPEFADAMVEPLISGRVDHVIGNRLVSFERGALTRLNHFGNVVMNIMFKWVHGVYMTDILSGYRGFTRESLDKMHLTEDGFGIETEISSEIVRNNLRFEVVPTYYRKRTGSPTKLRPFSDGLKIILAINRFGKLNNPLFPLLYIGITFLIVSIGLAIYILFEWFKEIEHLPLTILTVLLAIVGLLTVILGFFSNIMVAHHREAMMVINRLSAQIEELKK